MAGARSPDLVRQAGKQRGDGTNRLQSQWLNTSENIVERAKGNFDFGDGRVEEQPHYEVLVK